MARSLTATENKLVNKILALGWAREASTLKCYFRRDIFSWFPNDPVRENTIRDLAAECGVNLDKNYNTTDADPP